MTEGLRIEVRASEERHVVVFDGELDLASIEEVNQALVEVGAAIVVANLYFVDFIDRAGVEALASAKKRIEATGKGFEIRGAGAPVRRVFAALAMDELLAD